MNPIAEVAKLAQEMYEVAQRSTGYIKIVGRGTDIMVLTNSQSKEGDVLLRRYLPHTVTTGLSSHQWNDLTQCIVVYRRSKS